MVLLLAEMQRGYLLKLPFRASKCPDHVAAALPKSAPDILRLTEEKQIAEWEKEWAAEDATITVAPLPPAIEAN